MKNYKLLLAYDGTCYSGWQIQPNAISIQEIVENAIQTIVRHDVRVIGYYGRTDAGVHALEQPAHFKSPHEIDLYRFKAGLNGILPRDIRMKDVMAVPDDFHAQYSAKGKEYHYHLYLDKVMNPFRRLYCWHVHAQVDLKLLESAAQYFVGTHDFSAISNETHRGSASKDPVRTLKRIDMIEEEEGVRLEFEGDGFLFTRWSETL